MSAGGVQLGTDERATERLLAALADARRENEQLREALQSRVVIEQAKGVLAERHGVRLDVAFEALRRAARSSNRRIHDLAREVLAGPRTPARIVRELERVAR